MKLKYQINKNSICFGEGKSFIQVDCNNNVYNNLVNFLDNLSPQNKIYINLKNNFKLYLILLKSIFYSKISMFNLYLINPNQVHKYILSKVFRGSIFLKIEKKINKLHVQRYKADIKKLKFQFKYSVIFISQKINYKFVEKLISEFSSFDIEFIFVINEETKHRFPNSNIKVIYYKSNHDLRFNMSKKKNLGIKSASGEILVVTHDRIQITAQWLLNLSKFSNSFDLYGSKIFSQNFRFLDKVAYKFKEYLFLSPKIYYLTYDENNSFQYLDGGLIVLNNKRFFGQKIFDESLNWTEMEDVDFSARTKLECNLVSFDKNNYLSSDFKQHFKLSKNPLMYIYKSFVMRFINPF